MEQRISVLADGDCIGEQKELVTGKQNVSVFSTRIVPSIYSHDVFLRDVLTLLAGVAVRRGHLNVIGGEQASDPVDLSFPPIRVALVHDVDQLTFREAHFVPVGGGVVIYGNHLTD